MNNNGSYALLSYGSYAKYILALTYDRFTSKLVFGGQSVDEYSDFLMTVPSSDISMSLLYVKDPNNIITGYGKINLIW